MDPITGAIVAGLTAGVAGGVTEAGKSLIVDAYQALKAALRQRCGLESELAQAVDKLEQKPDSTGRQETLREEVEAAGVAADAELKTLAAALLQALQQTAEGQVALGKYQIQAGNIGVVGDNTQVEGGIHFGKP